jgi:hypothetical protein
VGRRAFLGAQYGNHQEKMHGEKRWFARFIMHAYGGKLLKTLL